MARTCPWTQRTGVDARLMQHTGLDEMTLTRLRKEFHRLHRTKRVGDKPFRRFAVLLNILRYILTPDQHWAWNAYTGYTERDLAAMVADEYPIGLDVVRDYSALMGIKRDYLLLGTAPVVDKAGASIEVWPMQDAR